MLNKRKAGRMARNKLSRNEYKIFSEKICRTVQNFITEKHVIMLYNAIDNEVDVSSLSDFPDKIILFPRVEGEHIVAVKGEKFKTGAYGIREPLEEEFFGKIDIVIVPMCAFDENCNRLGFGKGYYDRFLKEKNCLKLGVAFSCQKTEGILVKETDVKMDYIITENEVLECLK